MSKDYIWAIVSGAVLGLIAVLLVKLGNPANMGFCIACFTRDIAGSLGLFNWAAGPKYIRPEIIGIFFGALIAAFAYREFRPKGGSAPVLRFLLGMFMMIGALVFLGCPTRMILRLGGGDYNALVALAGFIAGAGLGVLFIRSGFSLDKPAEQNRIEAYVLPGFMLLLLALAYFAPRFAADGPILISPSGHPGSGQSPVSSAALGITISLVAGLVVGFLAQRSRLCFAGGWRDLWLARFSPLLAGVLAVLVVVAAGNLITGAFHPGFVQQPIAHTSHLWNFLGMSLVGICAVLLGGCPFRQVALAGSGSSDAAVVFLGMLAGAAFSHNLALVSTAAESGGGPGPAGQLAVILGLTVAVAVAALYRRNPAIQG